MDVIPYESGSFYVFDRAYNDYHRLYKIHMMDSFFVVRAKTNIKAKVLKWKRRLPKNIQSDCEIELTGFYTQKSYPETIRLVRFWMKKTKGSSFILQMQNIFQPYRSRNFTRIVGKWNCSLNGSSNTLK